MSKLEELQKLDISLHKMVVGHRQREQSILEMQRKLPSHFKTPSPQELLNVEELKERVLLMIGSEFYATYAPALLTLQTILTEATQNPVIVAKSVHDRIMRRKRKRLQNLARYIEQWDRLSGPEVLTQDPQSTLRILSTHDGVAALAGKYQALLGDYLIGRRFLDRQDRDLRCSLLTYGLVRCNRSFQRSFEELTKRLLGKLRELATQSSEYEIESLYPLFRGMKKLAVVNDPFQRIRIIQRTCQKAANGQMGASQIFG